ncbi:LysR family transcriptional regulator ArgP [Arthrobacter sp. M4]|uniref:LysR family transcriptional regulator ArgP n=1 Tax=Arthrobacter sp. M4 TaxID=218160 RepID=UPI001CDD1337|nr:LysR family transcriptional regulator ArgP [Arthrobacter sp. M4]MCA4133820.1 LysR family transcriptional regulator ArgP [Arthrobacter sp. M4]
MPRFSSEQLETFAAVLGEGTLEAAARRLHVTPSAVSQRLKALEERAGQVLLQRSNPTEATPAGQVILRLARQLALLEDDAGRELGISGQGSQHVAMPLGVNADSLAVWFLQALAHVPPDLQVTFELHRDDEQHSTDMLRSGTVMAAVTATPEPVQGCRVEPLGQMRYRAVASPAFVARWLPQLDDGGTVAAKALNAAPAVDFDRKDSYQWRFVETLFVKETARKKASQDRPPLGPRHYVPAAMDFAQAIRLGLGWGLVPEAHCGPDLAEGTLVELAPNDPFDVALYWQRWKIQSPLLDLVSATVRETASKHLHG